MKENFKLKGNFKVLSEDNKILFEKNNMIVETGKEFILDCLSEGSSSGLYTTTNSGQNITYGTSLTLCLGKYITTTDLYSSDQLDENISKESKLTKMFSECYHKNSENQAEENGNLINVNSLPNISFETVEISKENEEYYIKLTTKSFLITSTTGPENINPIENETNLEINEAGLKINGTLLTHLDFGSSQTFAAENSIKFVYTLSL